MKKELLTADTLCLLNSINQRQTHGIYLVKVQKTKSNKNG